MRVMFAFAFLKRVVISSNFASVETGRVAGRFCLLDFRGSTGLVPLSGLEEHMSLMVSLFFGLTSVFIIICIGDHQLSRGAAC